MKAGTSDPQVRGREGRSLELRCCYEQRTKETLTTCTSWISEHVWVRNGLRPRPLSDRRHFCIGCCRLLSKGLDLSEKNANLPWTTISRDSITLLEFHSFDFAGARRDCLNHVQRDLGGNSELFNPLAMTIVVSFRNSRVLSGTA